VRKNNPRDTHPSFDDGGFGCHVIIIIVAAATAP